MRKRKRQKTDEWEIALEIQTRHHGPMKTEGIDTTWYQNKIKGGLAETICRAHFEALGYSVEGTGIEQIAPLFCQLQGQNAGNYLNDVRKLQNLPDFLISRIHPESAGTQAGKADAVFVECKYRSSVILDTFTEEIEKQYSNLIEKQVRFIVYLVTKKYKVRSKDETFTDEWTVWLNFFNPQVSATKNDTGWHKAGEWNKFEVFSLYQGMQESTNFNTTYRDIVEPALKELFK